MSEIRFDNRVAIVIGAGGGLSARSLANATEAAGQAGRVALGGRSP